MRLVDSSDGKQASPLHDYFQMFFESADLVSAFWQPVLKGVGRQQLELARLSARQGQSMLQYVRNVSASPSPAGVAAATQHYWQSMAGEFTQSTRKLAAVATETVHLTASSEILTLPLKRNRDVMSLVPANGEDDEVRKVA